MKTFYVVTDDYLDTFAAETLSEALDLVNLDAGHWLVSIFTVKAPNAGMARIFRKFDTITRIPLPGRYYPS